MFLLPPRLRHLLGGGVGLLHRGALRVEVVLVGDEERPLGAEGLEVSVPARGSVRPLLRDMTQHLCSSISYGGARSLAELKSAFEANPERFLIKLSASSRAESFQR